MHMLPAISNSKILPSIVIIVFLVSINFSIGQYLRADLDKILYADQTAYVSMTKTFQKTGIFSTGVIPNSIDYGETELQKLPSFLQPEGSWPPLYFIFLASYYQLMGVLPQDSQSYGSLLDNILASIFLVIFFLFIKSRFNLQTAFFSSLLVSLIPFFNEQAAFVSPYQLMYIFSISALFFLDKRKSHYFLFGIFAGLAHLTHGFGIFLGFSYCLFLLINREFKGFAITSVTWLLVILPWMLRNYYIYKNIGMGLYIPFSSKLSGLLSFLLHQKVVTYPTDYLPSSIDIPRAFLVFANSFKGTNEFSGFDFLIAFIILFSGFAFFKLQKLRSNPIYLIIPVLAVLYIWGYQNFDNYTQLFFTFIFPISLFYLIYRYKRYIFENQILRIHRFIILFAFVSLIGFFYFSWYTESLYNESLYETGFGYAPTKMLMFSIFLLIPLAVEGLIKIIRKFTPQNTNKFSKIIPCIVIVLLSPIMIQSVEGTINGIPYIYSDTSYFYREDDEIKKTNDWAVSNIHECCVESNLPLVTVTKTGLASVVLPPDGVDQKSFEVLLHTYDLHYIIFYETNVYGQKTTHDNLINWYGKDYLYSEVYSNGNSSVIKAYDLSKYAEQLKDFYLLLEIAKDLENRGDMKGALLIYEKTKYIPTFKESSLESEIRSLRILGNETESIARAQIKNAHDADAQERLIQIKTVNERDTAVKLLQIKSDSFDNALKSYDESIGYFQKAFEESGGPVRDIVQKYLIDALDGKGNLLVELNRYDDANDVYLEIIRLDMFDKSAHEKRSLILEKLGLIEDAKRESDFAKRLR